MLPYGDRAWLVELGSTEAAAGLARSLRRLTPGLHLVEVVPADRTVLVRFDPDRVDARSLHRTLAELPPEPASPNRRVLDVPTRYDGDDLDEVARLTGLTVEDVVRIHSSTAYVVGFLGFAPGFAYLVGGDPRLVVPRRSTPRTSVPAGSVALADDFCGVYPRSSPGGWQLIGRTSLAVWDAAADPPTLWEPGATVRFVATPC